MSRVNQALRRASVEEIAHESALPESDAQANRSSVSVLESYPEEEPNVASPPRRRAQAAHAGAPPPARAQRALSAASAAALAGKLVGSEETARVSIEQYRRLAAALHELQLARGLKTLMVTSALPGEGKTLTAVNLALTLAESYTRRVLLIDADLRRPSLHEMFGLRVDRGLSEALRSADDMLPLVTVSERLTVLPAGRPDGNPTAALTSARMEALLEESARTFDWVLIDAPPVALLPDATLLARLTGAVLLVIRAETTPYALVERAVSELGRDCIVGSVLNDVDEQTIPATEYYHAYSAPRE